MLYKSVPYNLLLRLTKVGPVGVVLVTFTCCVLYLLFKGSLSIFTFRNIIGKFSFKRSHVDEVIIFAVTSIEQRS